MAKTQEAKDESAALVRQFQTTLKGSNSHSASPAKVDAFKSALVACVEAGALDKCNLKTPLGAAVDFALESSKRTAGQAVPVIWEEQAREMRNELGYKGAPLLDRMLIEHIVLCCFRLTIAELQFSAIMTHGGTMPQVEYHQRRVGTAQRRFIHATESLTRVRKLSRPSLQINVATEGGRQVNIA